MDIQYLQTQSNMRCWCVPSSAATPPPQLITFYTASPYDADEAVDGEPLAIINVNSEILFCNYLTIKALMIKAENPTLVLKRFCRPRVINSFCLSVGVCSFYIVGQLEGRISSICNNYDYIIMLQQTCIIIVKLKLCNSLLFGIIWVKNLSVCVSLPWDRNSGCFACGPAYLIIVLDGKNVGNTLAICLWIGNPVWWPLYYSLCSVHSAAAAAEG